MHPTLTGSSEIQHFEHSNVIKIHDRIMFVSTWDFHLYINLPLHERHLYKEMSQSVR